MYVLFPGRIHNATKGSDPGGILFSFSFFEIIWLADKLIRHLRKLGFHADP